MQLPSTQYLNECFTYDPAIGLLFWKHRPMSHFKNWRAQQHFNRLFAGKKAGCEHRAKDGKPKEVTIGMLHNGKFTHFGVHRIVLGLMGISIPFNFEVDHKDGNPFNNRWDNLRLATQSQQSTNRINRRGKKSGLPKGVTRNGNGFKARIGQNVSLGTFPTPEAAHAAYCTHAEELYGEFAKFN